MDECGMCMEPESLVPITCSGARQVVLIGDHKQLQPVVQDHMAKTLGLSVSMFERHSKRAMMLKLQYRMVRTVFHDQLVPSTHKQLKKPLSALYRSLNFANAHLRKREKSTRLSRAAGLTENGCGVGSKVSTTFRLISGSRILITLRQGAWH